jgi:hypothetical protein
MTKYKIIILILLIDLFFIINLSDLEKINKNLIIKENKIITISNNLKNINNLFYNKIEFINYIKKIKRKYNLLEIKKNNHIFLSSNNISNKSLNSILNDILNSKVFVYNIKVYDKKNSKNKNLELELNYE